MPRIRVLVVSHMFPSRERPLYGSFVKEQVDELARVCDVRVLSVRSSTETSLGEVAYPVSFFECRDRAGLPSSVGTLLRSLAIRREILRRCRSIADIPDVIHGHYAFPDGVAVSWAARSLGIPFVVTMHGSDANVQMSRAASGRMIAHWLRSAHAIVCVSEAMRQGVSERHPGLRSRLTVVPNGYSQALFPVQGEALPRKDVVFLGNVSSDKGVDLLVEAWANVDPGTRLVVAGQGPQVARLRQRVIELGLGDRVELRGPLPRESIASYLGGARLMVLPSIREGMPIVVLEALASGTPVVASPVGGIPELVSDGVNGVLVGERTPEAWASAVNAVLARDWDAVVIRRTVRDQTWSGVARQLVSVYQGAILGANGVAG